MLSSYEQNIGLFAKFNKVILDSFKTHTKDSFKYEKRAAVHPYYQIFV